MACADLCSRTYVPVDHIRVVRRRQTFVRQSPAVYWRRRAAVLMVVALTVIGSVTVVRVALGALGGGPLTAPDAPTAAPVARPVAAVSYVVRPGDTFWSIAHSLRPSGDIRP